MASNLPSRFPEGGGPDPDTVSASVVVLAKNEAPNIGRCLHSIAWADQIVVVDSGSTDDTVAIAKDAGAEVVATRWRGFGPQREFALRLESLRNDWVFFVDADEWVSTDLAREIDRVVAEDDPNVAAYWMYYRLVFQGTWIRHSGWYPSSRIVRLMRRGSVNFGRDVFSEHPLVRGNVARLRNDLVDEDLKGLANWLHKHVDYAVLEASRREKGLRPRSPYESRVRHFIKNKVAVKVPARPVIQFLYMYVIRGGFLDGRPGLSFCFYHAWFQAVVNDLQYESDR